MMPEPIGHLVLFLHAHLPFVRHPEHDDFLEEDWLYEAITETYLPLFQLARRWAEERLPVRLTLSLSPPLVAMLKDELLMSRYERRLGRLIDLSEREVERFKNDDTFGALARYYRDWLGALMDDFTGPVKRDVAGAFGMLQELGVVELATCGATHAFLPFYAVELEHARPQIRVAVKSYREAFDCNPPGIWLPECGYKAGLDWILADEGLCYFFLDTHGVAHGDPPPVFGHYAPVVCPSGVLAFPRDPEASRQVWSAHEGYPGDHRYREFYRDIGWDRTPEELEGLLLGTGDRRNVGIKYHRIGKPGMTLSDKEPYDRAAALEALEQHAEHFVASRVKEAKEAKEKIDRPAVMVAPYDAELFGHWWFEGPEFLDRVLRKAIETPELRVSTPSDVIKMEGSFQVSTPSASSWGDQGYGRVWCNERNDWMWPHLHNAAAQMAKIAKQHPDAKGRQHRALTQLARELLLASASDWPFQVTMDTTVQYAERRVRDHVGRFNRLLDQIETDQIDDDFLLDLEAADNIFPSLDYRDFIPETGRRG